MEEIWKDIKNYEGLYQISNLGNVKSKRFWVGNRYIYRDKILKTSKSSSGYLQVVFSKDGKTKTKLIHRLVAVAFLDNPNNYKEINHKDENKGNNNVTNLEWCSRKYNMNYGNIKEKMSHSKKIKVAKLNKDGNVIEIYNSILEASKINNCLATNIVACCKHKKGAKTYKGFKWEYAENL